MEVPQRGFPLASGECATDRFDQRCSLVDGGCGPEDVEIGTLQHDVDVVAREPFRVAPAHVVDETSRGDVRTDAAERRLERGALGAEGACPPICT